MDLIDIDSLERVNRFYGGSAGRKVAVLIDGSPWIVKYPESTARFMGKHLPSYTSSPLSEYIGSHVYGSLGIPVHDTLLGMSEGKIVVACRDFAVEDTFADFASIKNSISEDLLESGSNSSGQRGELLSDALTVIESAPVFDRMRKAVLERFWDMFVIDAVTQNNDRNNGNWGVLIKRYGIELAPVFDNGNALFNKRTPSVSERILDRGGVANDIMTGVSFFLDDNDRHIHPFDLMAQREHEGLQDAIDRFAANWNAAAVRGILDAIPESYRGIEVLDSITRKLYEKILIEGAEEYILPLASSVTSRNHTSMRIELLEAECCSENSHGQQGFRSRCRTDR